MVKEAKGNVRHGDIDPKVFDFVFFSVLLGQSHAHIFYVQVARNGRLGRKARIGHCKIGDAPRRLLVAVICRDINL